MTPDRDSQPGRNALIALAADATTGELMLRAAGLRDAGHGDLVSYSRKVFIPLTRLCRDVCHYCTFAHPPRAGEDPYLSPDDILAIARAGAGVGCHEALFTLGDKPELRYRAARGAPSGSSGPRAGAGRRGVTRAPGPPCQPVPAQTWESFEAEIVDDRESLELALEDLS